MNRAEATNLWRLAQAAAPQQAFDEWTPDAWALALDDIRFADAKDALIRVVKANVFIDIAAIRAEVRRIRDKRIADQPEPTPPDNLTPQQTIEWLRAWRTAVGDDDPDAIAALESSRGELTARDMTAIEDTFRTVPADG